MCTRARLLISAGNDRFALISRAATSFGAQLAAVSERRYKCARTGVKDMRATSRWFCCLGILLLLLGGAVVLKYIAEVCKSIKVGILLQ